MGTPLYIRSVYTLLSSMCSIESIVEYGKKYGYHALGLVDRNVLAGAVAFKKACQKVNIKPVYGLEFDVKAEDRVFTAVMYARDDIGFRNLMGLSSHICISDEKIIDLDTLNQYRENNILCLLSDNMPLTYAVEQRLDAQEAIGRQKEIFGEHIVGLVDHNIALNRNRDFTIRQILRDNGISCIALSRTYYLDASDEEDYSVLKCIRDKKTIDDPDISLDTGRYFLDQDVFRSLYDETDIANTDVLAQNCNVTLSYNTSLPEYQNKLGIPSKEYLTSLCREGLKRRLKGDVPVEYKKRLEYELGVILQMHFEDYFLIVYDFILYAKKNNVLVGPGRGSAAGSLVAYCLGITDIDPIKYGLIFERFLNPERISMPDIDTDFPDNQRQLVIDYVRDRYGLEHVGHIITYGTLKAKQVLRDVGRALNYQPRDIDSICKSIPNVLDMDLKKAYDSVPLFRQRIESDERYRRMYSIARKFEFNPRHESTHAAGIVFSKQPLSEIVPITKVEQDIYSTQYTMQHLEEFGLIKMDFLSITNLGIIAEIVEDINRDVPFDIRKIGLDDEKTFRLVSEANLAGVFQLESAGMRNLIRKMKPRTFEEIAVAIALFRPGPMKNIPTYLANRADPGNIEYLHPNLKPILKETYGVIIYQEQIMDIARKMAGFTYGKADILRKAMAKKKVEELESMHVEFINGCLKNGYSSQVSEKVYALILEFANYGFNKSHSIAYAIVAYQLAYLKANYPLYFYKALLNGVTSSQSKTYEYVSECIRIGQRVKGIDINESGVSYQIKDDAIVMPFSIVKDVGTISAQKIIEERDYNGPFKDYIEAVGRLTSAGVDRNVIENIIYAGGFDGFGHSRYTMIDNLNNVLMYANAHRGEISLMGEYDDAPIIRELKDDRIVSAENEKSVLGFYFTFNPILEIKKKYNIDTENLYDLAMRQGQVTGFGLIQRVKAIKTRKGDMMAFVDIVDDKGNLSLAVMPNLYSQFSSQLVKGRYVQFTGKIERENSCLVKTMKII
ncbi:MAG: DNA polymerase III subunit alpha [Erysipelotrichaceae bacterium]|nr:DNA polymerase III subunit alpha [Erysipelotrichaceae bacterium]